MSATTNLSDAAIQDLRAALRGPVIRRGEPGYEEARKVYNGMIDRRPGLIACCQDVADVIAAVAFAREQALTVAIRGGGHNGPGLGTCDDGLVIDLSRMKGVRVDPEQRAARVAGGCVWGDVDHAAHPFGLAAVSGIISTTGVGGLTLGGGHGHLSRKYGLTIDNLLEADMVLADGRFVTVDANRHPDLFWAIRGGGGNFGVVTSFLFRLHPVSAVYAGPMFWEMDQAADVMRVYHDFITSAPEEINGFFAFLKVPPAPPFPEELHARTMCGVVWCCVGDTDAVEQALQPFRRRVPAPAFEGLGQMPYPALQSLFDPLYPPGMQWYWKGDFVKDLPEEAIARHVEHGARLPSLFSTMHLYPINGAVHRVGPQETAFAYRNATYSEVIVGVDPDPANNDSTIHWTREYWEATHPYSLGGAYVNFMMEEGQERVQATYRDNYPRLVEIKTRYDPTNLFHVNQNIRPAS